MNVVRPVARAVFLAGLAVQSSCAPASGPDSPPNVIIIMTDDQGYGDFGATGNPLIRTPNIDALAAASAEMTNFYVSPVCSPTRASLMTGRYNYRTRVVDTFRARAMMDPGEVTIAEILRDAGYGTGIFGKWHLGDAYPMRPQDQGFDEVLVHRGGGIGQPSDPPGGEGKYTDPILLHNGELIQARGYCTDVYFDHAMSWIEDRARSEEPFFAYIAPNAPHGPFDDVPPELLAEYQQSDLGNDRFPQERGHPLPDDGREDQRARIFAMITNIDENVGRLMSHLETLGIADGTIVVFLTDNGPNQRRYVAGMRGQKSSVYEGGIRSPFWVHWPARLEAGHASAVAAAHIDVLPTVLDAAGVEVPPDLRLDGRSLLPLLTGAEDAEWADRHLVIQSHRGDVPVRYHNFMIRDDRWKLVHASGFGGESFEGEPTFELYELATDPLEEVDVADRNPEVVAALRGAYDTWFDDVGSTRPNNYAKLRIHIGTSHESVTVLTRNDWQPARNRSWGQPQANGAWDLQVTATAPYDIGLLFPQWFDGGTVSLTIGDSTYVAETAPGGAGHTFESVRLTEGPARLIASLGVGDTLGGPWQVEIRKR